MVARVQSTDVGAVTSFTARRVSGHFATAQSIASAPAGIRSGLAALVTARRPASAPSCEGVIGPGPLNPGMTLCTGAVQASCLCKCGRPFSAKRVSGTRPGITRCACTPNCPGSSAINSVNAFTAALLASIRRDRRACPQRDGLCHVDDDAGRALAELRQHRLCYRYQAARPISRTPRLELAVRYVLNHLNRAGSRLGERWNSWTGLRRQPEGRPTFNRTECTKRDLDDSRSDSCRAAGTQEGADNVDGAAKCNGHSRRKRGPGILSMQIHASRGLSLVSPVGAIRHGRDGPMTETISLAEYFAVLIMLSGGGARVATSASGADRPPRGLP